MHPFIPRRLALAALILGVLSTSVVVLPSAAHADSGAVTISAAPSTGSSGDSATLTTSGGLGCPAGSDVYPYLSKTVPALPLTTQVADDLMFDTNKSGQFADGVYVGASSGTQSSDSGEVISDDALQFGPNNQGDFFATSATLADIASAWGAATSGSTFGLTILCSDSDYDGPVDNNGVISAAVTTFTLTSAGDWTIGDQTPDASATTVTASQASRGSSTQLTATVADTTNPAAALTGLIAFYDGDPLTGTLIAGQVAVVDGVASYASSVGAGNGQLSAGPHTISASYTPASGLNVATSHGSVAVTVLGPVVMPTVKVAATAYGGQVALSATVVKADGSTATDATGTIDFAETTGSGWTQKAVAVTNGVATAVDSGLTAGTAYTFTATYTAGADDNYANSDASSPQTATPTKAAANSSLADGGSVTPGTAYDISFGAGTFAAGDTVDVVLHSDPVDLGTVTAAPDGSLTFTLPAATTSTLAAGSSHRLTFTSGADPTKVQTVSFTVPAAVTATTTSPGGSNPVSTFLTDSSTWMTGTPAGVATLMAVAVVALAGGVVGWNLLWRRRRFARR